MGPESWDLSSDGTSDHLAPADHLTLHLQIYPPKWQFEIPTDRFLLWEQADQVADLSGHLEGN